jgi:hypothetical protein
VHFFFHALDEGSTETLRRRSATPFLVEKSQVSVEEIAAVASSTEIGGRHLRSPSSARMIAFVRPPS